MSAARRTARALAEPVLVVLGLAAVTSVMTWPLVTDPGGLGRLRLNDARWSIWVVSWVAHALTTNPLSLLDANVFYPHRAALLLSEPNLVAGIIAAPAWALTRNALFAHNTAFFASFVLSGAAMYALARYLVASRLAAAVAALMFAFSSYAFAHTAHIQLEMTAGLPLLLLAIHRHADRPSVGRGAFMGGAMALQGLACGYYGALSAMMAPAGVLFFAVSRRRWRQGLYWGGAVAGAAVAAAILTPLFLPYLEVRQATGFTRSLEGSRVYSATWQSYVASGAWAHRWWLPRLAGWSDVLFPGFCAVFLAPAGVWLARRGRFSRDVIVFYVLLIVFAFWISLGPAGGLYTVLYETIVVFSFLRAPSRLGVAVLLGFAVLSAFAIAAMRERLRGRARGLLVLVPLFVIGELIVAPLPLDPMWPVSNSYRMLASLPRGPVAEFPFYWRNAELQHHAVYMLFSTYHWQPLVNGYSDIVPPDWGPLSHKLAGFPRDEALTALRERGTKYLVINYPRYRSDLQREIDATMRANGERFRELQRDRGVVLYEVVEWESRR
ncbi:MAG TPA: hypothetical protein VF178_01190 [Gemmatimonadaceae bacterium]